MPESRKNWYVDFIHKKIYIYIYIYSIFFIYSQESCHQLMTIVLGRDLFLVVNIELLVEFTFAHSVV
jgi:hypothetical protein